EAGGRGGEAPQDQRRIERERIEAAGGEPGIATVLAPGGDHRDPGREAAEALPHVCRVARWDRAVGGVNGAGSVALAGNWSTFAHGGGRRRMAGPSSPAKCMKFHLNDTVVFA